MYNNNETNFLPNLIFRKLNHLWFTVIKKMPNGLENKIIFK